ncbi:hypothetical protein [Streptomyces sp. NRRL WC-3549]|uniref:hypothetical protein n=1 Tax=Streptomyces sp. NRRL WC-3549 TaxID=1463925 RepID=UPI0004C8DD0D|nr:hypothetical protein [Streptomyces sp. NRRL WC-3549]
MVPVKRYAARAGAGLGALALVAGGVLWFGGGYDRWSSGRVLTQACDGVLPADEVRSVLGDRHLKAGKNTSEGSLDDTTTSLRVVCGVSRDVDADAGEYPGDGSVRVTVSGVPTLDHEDRAYESLYPSVRSALPPTPLGQGWNGVFSTGGSRGAEAKATTSVLLDCAAGPGDLLVTVEAEVGGYLDDTPLDDPRRRTAFARIATATAANASRTWNCDADLGTPLSTVALPVNEDEYVALADAEGTCSGISARGKAVVRAWESERGTAPFEQCVLGGADGHTVYTLVAQYGPYAESELHVLTTGSGTRNPVEAGQRAGVLPDGSYWTTADCPGGGEPALFRLVRYDDKAEGGGAGRAHALSALKVFAERSAAAHHCSEPAAPTHTDAP